MYKFLILFFLLGGLAFTAAAQNPNTNADSLKQTKRDSLNRKKDSVTSKRFAPKVTKEEKVYHPDSLHSPHKAVMRSLMIPGWGQIYNHRWWKVPVIYTGLGLLVSAIIFNQNNYAPNLVVAKYREKGIVPSPGDPQYSLYQTYQQYGVQDATIYSLVDGYRRNRDLSILGFLGAWGIQMVDAYIDAKFQHSYSMDTDFSFKIAPTIIENQPIYASAGNGPIITGLKLTFTLR